MSLAEYAPITVFAMPPEVAGAGACFAPQNTQCSAASGRSFVQLAHFFKSHLGRSVRSDPRNIGPQVRALQTTHRLP
jgi:hypothetical protein